MKVIRNIFNYQLLKECGITRHSEAKINLEKNSKKSLLITMLCLADQGYPKQAFIILNLQTKNVGEKYKRFAIAKLQFYGIFVLSVLCGATLSES